jgi:branched-chain amino acid transport system ATP-binding protein
MLGAFVLHGRREIEEELQRCFGLFPVLRERKHQRAGTLSGGEQQMLAMARALMGKPRLLLLDEPSLGLAPLVVRQIFQIIRELNQRGATLFLVEQNAHMALTVANRGYVLQSGRVILADSAANLLENPEVKRAYLGG